MSRVLLWILSLVVAAEWVQAHGLSVHWEVRDGGLVILAESEGEGAAGAVVEVRSADGEVLAAGELDPAGTWRWPISHAGDLAVVVDAGLGHRRTLALTEDQLRPAQAVASPRVADHDHPHETSEAKPGEARGTSDEAQSRGLRVVVGFAFLLALAAGWMSFGNLRRLKELERRVKDHEGRG